MRPVPISFTPEEVDLENRRLIEPAEPVKVRALIHFHDGKVRPECEAIAWTDRAVKIKWTMVSGVSREVWVWAMTALTEFPQFCSLKFPTPGRFRA